MESLNSGRGPELPPILSRLSSRLEDLRQAIRNEIQLGTTSIYPSVRRNFQHVGRNYLYGLNYLTYIAQEVLVKVAGGTLSLVRKENPEATLDSVIREFYNEYVRKLYLTAEDLQRDFIRLQVRNEVPHEVYLWVSDFLPHLVPNARFVFQEDVKFENEEFNTAILGRVRGLAELTQPTLDLSITEFNRSEFSKKEEFVPGSVITFAGAEAKNPDMWPIFIHEVFHIVNTKNGYLSIFLNFPKTRDVGKLKMPSLSDNITEQHNWLDELMVDYLSLRYFGPVYAFSLVQYFSRYPYPSTDEHPPMEMRLLATAHYLGNASKKLGKGLTEPFMSRLNSLLEGKTPDIEGIEDLSELLEMWGDSLGLPTYVGQLNQYQHRPNLSLAQTDLLRNPNEDVDLVPFNEPPFTVDEIREHFFNGLIPLAIHPNILFNVVFANYKEYDPSQHSIVLAESIRKWHILESWRPALGKVKAPAV